MTSTETQTCSDMTTQTNSLYLDNQQNHNPASDLTTKASYENIIIGMVQVIHEMVQLKENKELNLPQITKITNKIFGLNLSKDDLLTHEPGESSQSSSEENEMSCEFQTDASKRTRTPRSEDKRERSSSTDKSQSLPKGMHKKRKKPKSQNQPL